MVTIPTTSGPAVGGPVRVAQEAARDGLTVAAAALLLRSSA